jgi:hypothetical protein
VQFPETVQTSDPWGHVRAGELIDLLAWDPSERGWALRVGAADCLGCTEIQDYPDLIEPGPTRLWRTVLDWFRADCIGLVILSPDRGDMYRVLEPGRGGQKSVWIVKSTLTGALPRGGRGQEQPAAGD